MQSVTRLFKGGVPTEPGVRLLMETFVSPEPGTEISYAEISALINERPKTNRFRTIVTRWRDRLRREMNLESICEAGFDAVKILRENERERNARNLGRRNIKGLRIASAKANAIRLEKLSDVERVPAEHTQRHLSMIAKAATSSHNELATLLRGAGGVKRLTG